MHEGIWEKSAAGAFEIRGRTLGVVGYGRIGRQVAQLAEAVGMKVIFHDVVPQQAIGRAEPAESLEGLLRRADFVSLHVPGTAETRNLVGASELGLMRPGAYLINLSRGNVVDIEALRDALASGRLAGAAIDVFPDEPAGNLDRFTSVLSGVENVILTPHIGGSTEEAQQNIGREVSEALVGYLDGGSTQGAVNFPNVHLPAFPGSHRLLWIHRNVPGALRDVNRVIGDLGINISGQQLGTMEEVGYLVIDVNREASDELKRQIGRLGQTIRTRILY
jgi:D-3-phosphoglycerate dehydrogenase